MAENHQGARWGCGSSKNSRKDLKSPEVLKNRGEHGVQKDSGKKNQETSPKEPN